jgi:hypothetical protein
MYMNLKYQELIDNIIHIFLPKINSSHKYFQLQIPNYLNNSFSLETSINYNNRLLYL